MKGDIWELMSSQFEKLSFLEYDILVVDILGSNHNRYGYDI